MSTTTHSPPNSSALSARYGADGSHDIYLDWLRGIAALLVFVTHLRGGFFVKWTDLDPESRTALNYGLFFVTRLGREAVVVFFVLSGYLVGGQAVQHLQEGRFSLRRYFCARLARLYTVLIPALFLTFLFDFTGKGYDPARHGPAVLVTNLVFLQNFVLPSYGSNGPLWSLSYEWWFYFLCGFSLIAFARARPEASRAAIAIAVLSTLALIWHFNRLLVLMFPLWLFGVAAHQARGPSLHSSVFPILGFAGLAGAAVVSAMRWDLAGDYFVGFAAAVLLYTIRGLRVRSPARFSLGRFLASISFTVYAIHYPLLGLVIPWFVPQRHVHAGLWEWLSMASLGLGALAFCYAVYLLFEQHTPRVRRWLERTTTFVRH